MKDAAVGSRVRVFWEGDDAWFEGTVTEYAAESGYFVVYDDGEQQWEAEDATRIEFLHSTDDATQLMLQAEAEDPHDVAETEGATDKWSAPAPPSTAGYDDDEYDDDQDLEDAEEERNAKANPKPEDEGEEMLQHEEKSPERAAVAVPPRAVRDPTKYAKSGVFFRDPETLKETKVALQKERHELQQQYKVLAAQLEQKEQLSQSLKRELHGLKALVSVASLKSAVSNSPKTLPKTASDWVERVTAQKTTNRALRQELNGLQAQLTQEQATLQKMVAQKEQLQAKLARVPRKERCSLAEIQVEIAQVMAEKRELEKQLGASLTAERSKEKTKECRVSSHDQPDTKSELEQELRQLEKTLVRVGDESDEWKLSYEKENAKIVPLRVRIESLQAELRKHERSQVLLRSLFIRLDRSGSGTISVDAALAAIKLLAPGANTTKDRQGRLSGATSMDFATFARWFRDAVE